MPNRLTRIITRTGDDGTTGLGDGRRVNKDDARIEAIGTVDELNSVIGLVLAQGLEPGIADMLTQVQHWLFDLGGELALPGRTLVDGQSVERLERWLEALNAPLPPLREFVLPGGVPAAAHCHLARTVCRRAERCLARLSRHESVNSDTLKFLNRLSDLLFVMARTLNRAVGEPELGWSKPEKSS
jgi:cob(I)alamin adenosyltransferase